MLHWFQPNVSYSSSLGVQELSSETQNSVNNPLRASQKIRPSSVEQGLQQCEFNIQRFELYTSSLLLSPAAQRFTLFLPPLAGLSDLHTELAQVVLVITTSVAGYMEKQPQQFLASTFSTKPPDIDDSDYSNIKQMPFLALFPSTIPFLISTLEDRQALIESPFHATSQSLKQ